MIVSEIKRIHSLPRHEDYGSPRMHRELFSQGVDLWVDSERTTVVLFTQMLTPIHRQLFKGNSNEASQIKFKKLQLQHRLVSDLGDQDMNPALHM